MTFGEAIQLVKQGKLVSRAGWNGRDMFIFMRPADALDTDFLINKVKSLPESVKRYYSAEQFNNLDRELPKRHVVFTGYLCMKAADETIVNGWLASQTDILAEDWVEFANGKYNG